MSCLINGVSNRWTGIQTGMVEWTFGGNFFACTTDGTVFNVFQLQPLSSLSTLSDIRRRCGASQYKAELTIGRLVSKQPLSRVWHCSETMFLKDSIIYCIVHSVPAVSCSVFRHPLFQCLSIKLKISHQCVSNEKVIVVVTIAICFTQKS